MSSVHPMRDLSLFWGPVTATRAMHVANANKVQFHNRITLLRPIFVGFIILTDIEIVLNFLEKRWYFWRLVKLYEINVKCYVKSLAPFLNNSIVFT